MARASPLRAPVWRRRQHVGAALVLVGIAAVAWVLTLRAGAMDDMSMGGPGAGLGVVGGLGLFLVGWGVMMLAMMLPATLPLLLLHRATARRHHGVRSTAVGTAVLIAGYMAVWTAAGLPVYGYGWVLGIGGPVLAVIPGLLLVIGGLYQFTGLKHRCHERCTSPLFFLTRHYRPGWFGAARLGVLHGIDCLGCCVGIMLALVGLGMMNVAWMLTVAVVILVEKTFPGGHRIAAPLGVALVAGGFVLVGVALFGGGTGM